MNIMKTKPACWTNKADKVFVYLARDVAKKAHLDAAGKAYTDKDFDRGTYGCDGNNNEMNLTLTPMCRTCARMLYSQKENK